MTMHLVLGDGEMTRKELTSNLNELWQAAGDEAFWFVVQGKSDPTDTDKAIVNWLTKNEIYFEVVTDVKASMDDIYEDAQQVHEGKKLAAKVLDILNTSPEDGEDAKVLALFVNTDDTVEEDRWLGTVLESVSDAEFPAFALNDGMVELEFSAEEAEEEAEEEEAPPAKPSKTAAKKAPAKKAAAPVEDDEEEEEAEEAPAPAKKKAAKKYTREDLEDLELSEVKEIAAGLGITLPPRTRVTTYIDRILGGGDGTSEAEVEEVEPPTLQDYADIDALADLVLEKFIERLTR